MNVISDCCNLIGWLNGIMLQTLDSAVAFVTTLETLFLLWWKQMRSDAKSCGRGVFRLWRSVELVHMNCDWQGRIDLVMAEADYHGTPGDQAWFPTSHLRWSHYQICRLSIRRQRKCMHPVVSRDGKDRLEKLDMCISNPHIHVLMIALLNIKRTCVKTWRNMRCTMWREMSVQRRFS